MLLGREVEGARGAVAAEFEVIGLAGAVGDAVVGGVGDGQHEVVEALVLGGGFGFEPGDLVLLVGDEGTEAFEIFVVSAGFSLADFLGDGVPFGQCVPGGGDFCAAPGIDGQYLQRHRREAPAGQRGVEIGGVFADQADVVHGFSPGRESAGLCTIWGGVSSGEAGIPTVVFWGCFGSGLGVSKCRLGFVTSAARRRRARLGILGRRPKG